MTAAMKSIAMTLGLVWLAVAAWAGPQDAWITTKAKIALLTTDGVSVTGVNVDTVDGNVTLHGKVRFEAEKAKAAAVVQNLDGVKSVRNLLQIVPEEIREGVKVSDASIKTKLESLLEADPSFDGVKVASVNNGLVLLSGNTDTLETKLRVIETAWTVPGVKRVSSEIQTGDL